MGIFDRILSTFSNAELESDTEDVLEKIERRRQKRLNARDDTRALIIDDSPTIVFSLKKILRSSGFITLEALDAETGLDIARRQRFCRAADIAQRYVNTAYSHNNDQRQRAGHRAILRQPDWRR